MYIFFHLKEHLTGPSMVMCLPAVLWYEYTTNSFLLIVHQQSNFDDFEMSSFF